jgi:hypothetical protein
LLRPESRAQSALYLTVWLFIAVVSVHDGYLMAIHRDVHRAGDLELNPLAQWLITIAGGRVWLLLAAKACGTVLTCALLLFLFWRRRRVAWTVTLAIAAFQLLLLIYLLIA